MNANIKEQFSFQSISSSINTQKKKKPTKKIKKTPTLYMSRGAENVAVSHQAEHVKPILPVFE